MLKFRLPSLIWIRFKMYKVTNCETQRYSASRTWRMSIKSILIVGFYVTAVLGSPLVGHGLRNQLTQPRNDDNPEIKMNTGEIIANRGYPIELHYVTTPDGYILESQRIPHGLKSGPAPNKPVVFLQHGLLSSSADWIIGKVGDALGYVLADAGYDVWLGAVRGNTYGRNHTTLNPDTDSTFWDFSFDQIGQIDVPAQLNYILALTKQSTLSYVGHSQGTLTFFIAMETHPELNSKINQMFALAPATKLENMKSPLRLLAPYIDSLETILNLLGVDEFLPSSEFFDLVGQELCYANSPVMEVCENILFLIAGPDVSEFDPDTLSLILSHTPAGTSVQNMVHYGQEVRDGTYGRYDFGPVGNANNYGQRTPPPYDPAKVLVPIMTFWGDNDWLVDPLDVKWAEDQFPNLVESVHIPPFNHLDFLWALHVRTLVNDVILANLPIKP